MGQLKMYKDAIEVILYSINMTLTATASADQTAQSHTDTTNILMELSDKIRGCMMIQCNKRYKY